MSSVRLLQSGARKDVVTSWSRSWAVPTSPVACFCHLVGEAVSGSGFVFCVRLTSDKKMIKHFPFYIIP